MENATYVALSRQMVLQHQMDVIANNLANMTTPAYKAEDLIFVEYLNETDDGESISFVQDLATVRDLSPGPLAPTSNPLDLALADEGYFVIETGEGNRYTRAGNFTLDESGRIVTSQGQAVLSEGGSPITIPTEAARIIVAPDGTVSTELGRIGRVQVVYFENDQLLTKLENGLYDANEAEPIPSDDPQITQGMIENSNVSGIFEMTKLISTVRSYQAAQSLVEQENQTLNKAIESLLASTTA
jgi:flagellar basal-body rod protein FlgF